MAIEDIYNKTDKAKEYHQNSVVAISIFLVAAVLIVIVLYNKLDEYLENQAEEQIRIEEKLDSEKSRAFQALQLCSNIRPDDRLQFIKSQINAPEKDASSAVFTYQVNGDLEEAISKTTTPLISAGWKFKAGDNLELENGYRTISIKSVDYYQKLEIHCRQKELSSKIYD